MQAELDELREKIINAFSSAPRPEKEEITKCECWECAELKEIFSPLQWDKVPPEIIEGNFGELSLFEPKAYRYFLPAYILRCLDNFDPDSLGCEFVIYSVTPDKSDETQHAWSDRRFSILDAEQRKAIASFLELIISTEEFSDFHDKALYGLRTHWSEFSENKARTPGGAR